MNPITTTTTTTTMMKTHHHHHPTTTTSTHSHPPIYPTTTNPPPSYNYYWNASSTSPPPAVQVQVQVQPPPPAIVQQHPPPQEQIQVSVSQDEDENDDDNLAVLETLFYNEMISFRQQPTTTTTTTNTTSTTNMNLYTSNPTFNLYTPPILPGPPPPPPPPKTNQKPPPILLPTTNHPSLSTNTTAAAAANTIVTPTVPSTTTLHTPPPPTVATTTSTENTTCLMQQFTTLANRLGISLPPNIMNQVNTVPTTTTTTTTTGGGKRVHYRRKKKPKLQDCEIKYASLKAENAMLKKHLNQTKSKRQFDEERLESEQQMRQLLNQTNKDDSKIDNLLKNFREMYADYGKHRQQELNFHLQQLERLAAPTTVTKMSLWTIAGNNNNNNNNNGTLVVSSSKQESSNDAKKDTTTTNMTGKKRKREASPLAILLQKELEITPIQAKKILAQRERIQRVCQNIQYVSDLIAKLKALCEYKQKVFSNRMRKCQQILKPPQVLKLLLWIDDHADTLEHVCPGWGSERIHKQQQQQQQQQAQVMAVKKEDEEDNEDDNHLFNATDDGVMDNDSYSTSSSTHGTDEK